MSNQLTESVTVHLAILQHAVCVLLKFSAVLFDLSFC